MADKISPAEFLPAKNWWALAVRGFAAVAFGLLCFALPEVSLTLLILGFALYALLDGLFAVVASLYSHGGIKNWWGLLLEGLLGLSAGVLALTWPEITAILLLFLIALWAILTGIMEVIAGIWLEKIMPGNGMLILGGILSLIFGFLLINKPSVGALAVLWLIGIYAVLSGTLLVAIAFMLKGMLNYSKMPPVREPELKENPPPMGASDNLP